MFLAKNNKDNGRIMFCNCSGDTDKTAEWTQLKAIPNWEFYNVLWTVKNIGINALYLIGSILKRIRIVLKNR